MRRCLVRNLTNTCSFIASKCEAITTRAQVGTESVPTILRTYTTFTLVNIWKHIFKTTAIRTGGKFVFVHTCIADSIDINLLLYMLMLSSLSIFSNHFIIVKDFVARLQVMTLWYDLCGFKRNLSNYEKESWKKIRLLKTGIEPVTTAILVQCFQRMWLHSSVNVCRAVHCYRSCHGLEFLRFSFATI